MFRLLTLFIAVFSLIMTLSGAYLHVVPAELAICEDFSVCYPKIADILAGDSLGQSNLIWLTHTLSFSVLMVLVSILLLVSFKTKIARFPSAVLLAFVGFYVQIGLHPEWFAAERLSELARYLLSIFVLASAFYLMISTYADKAKRRFIAGHALVLISAVIVLLQLALGTWLAVNDGALVCGEFPRCVASWWPPVDYLSAFDLFLSFDTTVAVHWLHRVLSALSFISLTWLMLSATASRIQAVRSAGMLLGVILLIEVATGIAIVKLSMPEWTALVHSLLATVMLLPLLAIWFYQGVIELVAEGALESADEPIQKVDTTVVEATGDPLYSRLKSQLGKTRTGALGTLLSLGGRKLDADVLEEIETSLIMADVGMDVTTEIINTLQESVEKHQLQDAEALTTLLKQQLLTLLEPVSAPLVIPKQDGPFVILVVGVNGVGKTTTIGKLAQRLQREGHSVMLAAGDTFRAAAVEQLQTWGERNQIHVVAQHTGADSASVIFDGVQSAKAKGIDVLIADTAGRLHTKSNLMEELKKVKRIISKVDDTAPHEVLLVLDAGTGQNALSQAEHFNNTVDLTGIALTKLDGTAKGGIIFALAKQRGIPIRFLGVGEGIDDLQDFNAADFIDALFEIDKN